MRRKGLIAAAAAALAAATVTIAPAAGATSTPLTIVFETVAGTRALVHPAHGPGLSPQRGALRQDPGFTGMLTPGDTAPYRISEVSGAALARMSVAGMVNTLKAQITRGTYGARAHLVSIDELEESFGEAPPAHPTRAGRLAPVSPASPGARFSAAMQILAGDQSPWGGTWASRVEVYVSPGVTSSIGMGGGPNHNLVPDGLPLRRSYRGVGPGLALAGGIHLEMYHGAGNPLTAYTAELWRKIPGSFLSYYASYGGSPSVVHLVFTRTTRPAGAPRAWGNAMTSSWKLAESTAGGRTILANGPDAYRLGNFAGAWLAQYNALFPV